MIWLYAVERLALRAVAPRRAARRLRPPRTDNDSSRPLCAGGVVAARPLPPPNGHAIAVSKCAALSRGISPGRRQRASLARSLAQVTNAWAPGNQAWIPSGSQRGEGSDMDLERSAPPVHFRPVAL